MNKQQLSRLYPRFFAEVESLGLEWSVLRVRKHATLKVGEALITLPISPSDRRTDRNVVRKLRGALRRAA